MKLSKTTFIFFTIIVSSLLSFDLSFADNKVRVNPKVEQHIANVQAKRKNENKTSKQTEADSSTKQKRPLRRFKTRIEKGSSTCILYRDVNGYWSEVQRKVVSDKTQCNPKSMRGLRNN